MQEDENIKEFGFGGMEKEQKCTNMRTTQPLILKILRALKELMGKNTKIL